MYRIAVEGCRRAVFLACWAGAINLFFSFSFASVVTWAEGEVRTDAGCCHFKGRVLPTDIFIWRETHMCIHTLCCCTDQLVCWRGGIISFCGCVWKRFVKVLEFILTAFYITWSPDMLYMLLFRVFRHLCILTFSNILQFYYVYKYVFGISRVILKWFEKLSC